MTGKPISKLWTGGAYPHLTKLPDPPKPSDAMQQLPHVSRAYTTLESYFRQQPDVLVGGDGYLCYDAGDIRRAPRPDCVVAFGVPVPPADIVEANGYTISEIGKSPDFVLEVASEATGRRDYTVKRDIYAGYGVTEYWRFDHTGGQFHDAALAGDLLVNGVYQPIPVETGDDGIMRGYSAALGLELHWYEARLRFWNPAAGKYLPDLIEALDALTDERAARQAAEEEVSRLRAELREQSQG